MRSFHLIVCLPRRSVWGGVNAQSKKQEEDHCILGKDNNNKWESLPLAGEMARDLLLKTEEKS